MYSVMQVYPTSKQVCINQYFDSLPYRISVVALMVVGDLTYEDRMYNSNTVAYYKLAYLIYIIFVVLMTIMVTNLLIGKQD
jgi:hypothetical protein